VKIVEFTYAIGATTPYCPFSAAVKICSVLLFFFHSILRWKQGIAHLSQMHCSPLPPCLYSPIHAFWKTEICF
jgi:hypothetical protein